MADVDCLTANSFDADAFDETKDVSMSQAVDYDDTVPNPWKMEEVKSALEREGGITMEAFTKGVDDRNTDAHSPSTATENNTKFKPVAASGSLYEFQKFDEPVFEIRDLPSVYCFDTPAPADAVPFSPAVVTYGGFAENPNEISARIDQSEATDYTDDKNHEAVMKPVEEQRSRLYHLLLQYQQQQGSQFDEKNTGISGERRQLGAQ